MRSELHRPLRVQILIPTGPTPVPDNRRNRLQLRSSHDQRMTMPPQYFHWGPSKTVMNKRCSRVGPFLRTLVRRTKLEVDFDGPTLPFFLKMYDFFATQKNYLDNEDAYANLPKEDYPFKDGRPSGKPLDLTRTAKLPSGQQEVYHAKFDPHDPKHICRAWSSLGSYCKDEDEACACYSGTHYVPDQWNSLAAGCAVLTTRCTEATNSRNDPWCQMALTASSASTYCPTDVASVKFAATADIEKTRAQPAQSAAPTPRPATTSNAATTTQTPQKSSTLKPVETTRVSTYTPIFVRTSSQTRSANSNTSQASCSQDLVTPSIRPWILLCITLILYL
jgi:hypothetical protein